MNYFAHGRSFLDRPYFVAGTAVPDWLNVINRRAKARSAAAQPLVADPDPMVVDVAAGIIQHHHDDRWFHQTRAFAELNLQFSVDIRDCLADDTSFRPSFLGHILVELLLDATLIEQQPDQLDRYYKVLDEIDPQVVGEVVNRIATQPVDNLPRLIPRFSAERFLYDYLDDERLLYRLNNVMHRVRLPQIPAALLGFFPDARDAVRRRSEELLTSPADED